MLGVLITLLGLSVVDFLAKIASSGKSLHNQVGIPKRIYFFFAFLAFLNFFGLETIGIINNDNYILWEAIKNYGTVIIALVVYYYTRKYSEEVISFLNTSYKAQNPQTSNSSMAVDKSKPVESTTRSSDQNSPGNQLKRRFRRFSYVLFFICIVYILGGTLSFTDEDYHWFYFVNDSLNFAILVTIRFFYAAAATVILYLFQVPKVRKNRTAELPSTSPSNSKGNSSRGEVKESKDSSFAVKGLRQFPQVFLFSKREKIAKQVDKADTIDTNSARDLKAKLTFNHYVSQDELPPKVKHSSPSKTVDKNAVAVTVEPEDLGKEKRKSMSNVSITTDEV